MSMPMATIPQEAAPVLAQPVLAQPVLAQPVLALERQPRRLLLAASREWPMTSW
jgi:hypothetical protein